MVETFDLDSMDDRELLDLSWSLGLALNLDEMLKIRDHFRRLGRSPTDVELQALGQAWSEHSCYKSSKIFLRNYLFRIQSDDFIVNEDAGVVMFDEKHAYVVGLESHNHPSAIEPYGGAATGVGGILRDVVCMGAQPIALIDPLFFGPLEISHEDLPEGVKHPGYLFRRVVEGIRDYGNRVGIPTVCGLVWFDPGYLGNCLVNVGCIGIVRLDRIVRSRVGGPGEIFVLTGGSTGRDGIHGVTFASEVLDEVSEEENVGAVQLGDPIIKEPLIHACLEAVREGIVRGMKDLGGGGLSSCIGEMALSGGCGAEIDLEKVPLKYENMRPWEIWISESQERMMISVMPEHLERLLSIFDSWDVPATPIGRSVPGNRISVRYRGETVLDLDLGFYTAGPMYERPFTPPPVNEEHDQIDEPADYEMILLSLLSSPNLSSREWVIRQYDHEVRGATVLNPLQGRPGYECHGDAAVIRPLDESYRGLAITADVNPAFMRIHPYWGAVSAVDEVCRNLISVGARPHVLADCLNFGNPEDPHRLGEFREALRGLSDAASEVGLPFVSGNVSFYNETPVGPIPPTPTLLGIGLLDDVREVVSMDIKCQGSALVLIGDTKIEMGGSQYYEFLGLRGKVPRVNFAMIKRAVDVLPVAIHEFEVLSCHDVSEGGIGIALAEMAMAGNSGLEVDLRLISDMRPDYLIFSESNTRWIIEMHEDLVDEFLRYIRPLKGTVIGNTGGDELVVRAGDRTLISTEVEYLREAWSRYLHSHFG